jgi:tryptophan-rich sensory protein
MKQSPHQRKSGCFWVGITLLAIVAILWLILVPTAITDESEEAAYLIGGLLALSAIPIVIVVYCMSRGRRQTMEKETLTTRAPFAKDAKVEMVIRAPSGFRGAGWFLLVFGMAWFPLAPIVEDQVWGLGFIGGRP